MNDGVDELTYYMTLGCLALIVLCVLFFVISFVVNVLVAISMGGVLC